MNENARALANIRRNFGMVVLKGLDLSKSTEKFQMVMKLLKKIGANLKKIIIYAGSILTNRQLLELLDQARNLKQLYMDDVELKSTNDQADLGEFKRLDGLKVFQPIRVINHEILHLIPPSTLPEYKIDGDYYLLPKKSKYWKDKDSKTVSKILMKTENLEILCLSGMTLSRFECSPKNCNLKSISINCVTFLEREAFLNFKKFVMMQKSLTHFSSFIEEIDYQTDLSLMPELNRHDYTEIFEHVYNLKTLNEVGLMFRICTTKMINLLNTAKICNPSVKTLKILAPVKVDFGAFARCFPNVDCLDIVHSWGRFNQYSGIAGMEYMCYEMKSLNTIENVKKLEFNYVNEYMIGQIELKKLRELTITEYYNDHYPIYYEFEGSRGSFFSGARTDLIDIETFDVEYYPHAAKWINFAKKNQQLEVFKILKGSITCVHLEILMTKLPNLKSLEVERIWIYKIAYERIIDVIGRNFDRFEHIKMELINYLQIQDKMEDRLKQMHPNVTYRRDGVLIHILK